MLELFTPVTIGSQGVSRQNHNRGEHNITGLLSHLTEEGTLASHWVFSLLLTSLEVDSLRINLYYNLSPDPPHPLSHLNLRMYIIKKVNLLKKAEIYDED